MFFLKKKSTPNTVQQSPSVKTRSIQNSDVKSLILNQARSIAIASGSLFVPGVRDSMLNVQRFESSSVISKKAMSAKRNNFGLDDSKLASDDPNGVKITYV